MSEAGIGWTKLPDGRLLCRGCSDDADCQATGHQWSDWRPGYKNGQPDPSIEWRFCTHCGGGHEERLAEMGDTCSSSRSAAELRRPAADNWTAGPGTSARFGRARHQMLMEPHPTCLSRITDTKATHPRGFP